MKIAFEKREKKKAVSFYLTEPVMEEIRKICKKEKTTMSEVVEKFLKLGIDTYQAKTGK